MTTSTSETLTGARTMWELVDRRADASPDQRMLIAPDGETVTFGAFRDRAARVAAALHGMGVGTGSVVSWQLPTRIDSVVLSIALSRLGAVQNPIIHLYREREVGFALRQTGASLFVIPGRWRDVDFAALADARPRGCQHTPRHPQHRGRPSRGRPRGTFPRHPKRPHREDAPIRWIYYTSGSTADPKGVQHTDQTLDRGRLGPRPRARYGPRRRRLHRLPLRAHRGAGLSRHDADLRVPGHPRGGLLRAGRAAHLPQARRHHGGGQHRLLRGLPRRTAQEPGRSHPPRPAADVGGRCREAAGDPLRGARPRSAAAASCTGTA